MRLFAWLVLTLLLTIWTAPAILAQADAIGQQTGRSPEHTYKFVRYCHLELFAKFEKRNYGIIPIIGQPYSFEFWADSINRRYLVFVDIAARDWDVKRSLFIPYILSRYSNDYYLEACVRVLHGQASEPLLVKKYQVIVSGRKCIQFAQDDPNSGRLYVPYTERLTKETQAIKILATQLSADIFGLTN